MHKTHGNSASDLAQLVQESTPLIKGLLGTTPARWLLVDVSGQRLALVHGKEIDRVLPVSTAQVGIDCREDSGGTPDGLHRIAGLIGGDVCWGTEFASRLPTGRCWEREQLDRGAADEAGDLILSRILTLEGLEEGRNRGPGVDSLQRYIYIHGTNHEKLIGQPVSHGCIRMTNDDVCELFEKVAQGDPVLIV